MPLDFPANPSPNDTYSFGGKTWIWNGQGWALDPSGAINNIPIGNVTANTGNFTTLSVQTGVASDLIPTANITYDLGASNYRWNDLWLANSTIHIGNGSISANATSLILTNPDGTSFSGGGGGGTPGGADTEVQFNDSGSFGGTAGFTFDKTTNAVSTTGTITATGNISGSNLIVSNNIIDTGALEIITASNGNITLSPNGSGVIVASKDIRNGQANGTGNIGASGAVFNTVFAKATSAQYADLAEIYLADQPYEPGTVLEIGGTAEVTAAHTLASSRIAGVVSTDPAYIMNAGITDANAVKVALLGRVPCRVAGRINRGDLLTSSFIAGHAVALDAARYVPGCVIGKALEDHDSDDTGMIEIMVGRL